MIATLTITVGELPEFVSGNVWKKLNPKPITDLRARSQYNNPWAKADDVALIIAYENDQLLALVGLLPDSVNGLADSPLSTNSCWWADPKKGRQLALPLFLKAIAACNQRMLLTDCTPHTFAILKKTNLFDFPEVGSGTRGFLNFDFHEIVPRKIPSLQKLKPVFRIADIGLNLLLFPYRSYCQTRLMNKKTKAEIVTELDGEHAKFIESHSRKEFVRRSAADLQWIVRFPWITPSSKNETKPGIEYPFSYQVKRFAQYFLKVSEEGQMIGLALITIRDNEMKVPYVYFENSEKILDKIYLQALQQKVSTLIVFHPELATKMYSGQAPFIHRRRVKRLVALSKSLTGSFTENNHIQDGDGDVVFT